MKLSVTSFRAHSSAQKKILKYQNQLNYVTTHLPVVPNINSSSSTVSIQFDFIRFFFSKKSNHGLYNILNGTYTPTITVLYSIC